MGVVVVAQAVAVIQVVVAVGVVAVAEAVAEGVAVVHESKPTDIRSGLWVSCALPQ